MTIKKKQQQQQTKSISPLIVKMHVFEILKPY